MNQLSKLTLSAAIAGAALLSAGVKPAHALSAPLSAIAMQERGWDAPPNEFDDVSRRGFHDGIEGAHKDFDNHRSANPRNRDEFRHPHVPGRDREAYRRGFERGYQVGWEHIAHGR